MNITGWQKTSLIDYPGKIATILFTQGCPWRCGYCHNPELSAFIKPDVALIDVDEIFKFLDKRRELLDGLVITGGEPTLQTDLLDFLQEIKQRFNLPIKLDSNGVNPVVLQKIIEQKLVDYIAMDIKAPLPDYQAVVNVPIVADNIKKSIDIIMSSGLDYEFRSTILPHLHDQQKIMAMAKMIQGAKNYYLQKFRVGGPLLDPAFSALPAFSDQVMQQWQEVCRPYVQNCGLRL